MASNDQSDEHYDTTLRDDTSIEILSEGGDSHMRDSQWSIYSASRGSIAGSDASSMDFQKLNIHSKMATIVHHDGRQFIERRDLDDGGLPYSAEFYLGDELWKLSGEDCFLMSPRRYIAKVSAEGTVDLDGAVDFEEAVRTLLKHLKVVKVLLDEQLEECNKAKSALKIVLDKLVDGLGENIDYKRDVMLLQSLLQKHGNSLTMDYSLNMDYFQNCSRLSSEVMSTFGNFVAKALKLIQRNEILGHPNDSSLSEEFINDTIKEALNNHRVRLSAVCPSVIKDKLKEIADDHILYVSTEDMNLFNELTSFDQPLFDSALPMIFSKFLTKLQEINDERLIDLEPMSNCIYLYVCKSLQEVVEQLGVSAENDNVIVYSEEHGWKVTTVQEQSQTPYSKCLRQQLHMLAALANHFAPGGPFRTSRFPYEFKLFQNMDAIPEPVRIWLCLLDDYMKDLVQADIDKMQMLSCFFKSYVSFIASEEFHGEILESLRTITHDALRSLIDMKSSFQNDRSTSDSVLLECSDMISSCFDKFLCEHFGKDCEQIQSTLRRIVNQAMNVNSSSEEWAEFSSEFKQLLKGISDLPLEWYLQLPSSEVRNVLLRGQFVVPVDNRWKDTEHECLKVVDPEGFVKMYKLLHNSEEIPKHYQLQAIRVLLDKLAAVQNSYDRKGRSNKLPLSAITNMINSIRNSVLFLNRQTEYSCFEAFVQKMDESFADVIKQKRLEDNCNALPSMSDTAGTDRTDVETQDPLSNLFEGSISKGLLNSSLKIYTTQFNEHITGTAQFPREKRIEQIVSDVKHQVKPQLATSWTEEFKRNELPKVLAGLSAVWSLMSTKNGSSLEKLIKPSNLQISFVLSLFGDQNDEFYKLLYISTPQGKELVIGLTAAMLALHGHKVLIACFNSNLARRSANHLTDMFKTFAISHTISYGSIEDMARERSRKDYDKFAAYVHESLGLEMSAKNDNQPNDGFQCEKSVLLIEDIDLLLLNKTLGQAFKRYVRPTIPGLARVQEICYDQKGNVTLSQIDQLVKTSGDPELSKLRTFLDRPKSYTLYDPNHEEKKYTNKTLFAKHLETFITTYNLSYYKPNDVWLSRNGVKMEKTAKYYRFPDDVAYFSLKTSNFEQTANGYKNYGYFTLGYIPFPYVHLLKSYRMLFGFAAAPLDGYKELGINVNYHIYHKVAKSNPLRTIPVKFDSEKDFLCVESSENPIWDWMYTVMVAINSAIDKHRSVLVFFETGQWMEMFQREFELPLERMSVTAFETASNGENRAEDDVAVDEISVLVIEGNGELAEGREVHVIQTFFSKDSKEEDVIRRQAERSHGSGSYELIVSRQHVSIPLEYRDKKVTYDFLVKLRKTITFGEAQNCQVMNIKEYNAIEMFYNKF